MPQNDCYKIPLALENIISAKKHPRYAIERSIKDFLDMIILTNPGEYRRDELFGCSIWEKEFEILPLESRWQSQIKAAILKSVESFEPRLNQPKVNVRTDETSVLMKKIEISITGKIHQTGEQFEYTKTIYMCPKSID